MNTNTDIWQRFIFGERGGVMSFDSGFHRGRGGVVMSYDSGFHRGEGGVLQFRVSYWGRREWCPLIPPPPPNLITVSTSEDLKFKVFLGEHPELDCCCVIMCYYCQLKFIYIFILLMDILTVPPQKNSVWDTTNKIGLTIKFGIPGDTSWISTINCLQKNKM